VVEGSLTEFDRPKRTGRKRIDPRGALDAIIFRPGDTAVATTTSATDSGQPGRYAFSGISNGAGTYFIRQGVPAGRVQTAPGAPGYHTVAASNPSGNFTGRDFGDFARVTISGRKYNDLDNNGNDNSGSEPGLGGVTIKLFRDANGNGTF
jgi:hypothetical protein